MLVKAPSNSQVLALVGVDALRKTGSAAADGSGGGHTPIPFLHCSNAGAHNGFVSTSAIISVAGQYMNFTSPLQALSLTNLMSSPQSALWKQAEEEEIESLAYTT
jgi:hypothetical protein